MSCNSSEASQNSNEEGHLCVEETRSFGNKMKDGRIKLKP